MSDNTTPKSNGIIDQLNQLNVNVNTGAAINKNKLDSPGTIVSLKINLKASAKGCKIPQRPTTLGPRRLWIPPKIFLSKSVNKATNNNIGINGGKILRNSTSKTI